MTSSPPAMDAALPGIDAPRIVDLQPPDALTPPAPDLGAPLPQSVAEACAELGKSACDRLDKCAPLFVQLVFGPVKDCIQALTRSCTIDAMAPGARPVPVEIGRCARGLDNASCADILDSDAIDACSMPGIRPLAAVCGSDSQCASNYCRSAGACGRCGVRLPASSGCDSMLDDDRQCARGLTCANNVCVARAKAGEPCKDETKPCLTTLGCAGGFCVVPAEKPGAPCAVGGECSLGHGLFCEKAPTAVRGVCQPIKLPGPNELCSPLLPLCSSNAVCAKTLTGESRCLPANRDGEPCGDRAMGRNCVPSTFCVDGTCRLPNPSLCI